ncbi:MAG: metalloregulator ArsR/SmtB family transcription factor [Chloroflexi bacterium]|nr:metalloregulator ArsR/SmtB family transcription factor [Chloroflexota bacterium]MDA8189035.1 metalloregulator ArsR/SmtB family transcription factor [Dehalococcoidales bacterium]
MIAGQSSFEIEGERCREHGTDQVKVARGKELLLDDELYFHLAETFRTLADATRAKIVYSLLHQELCTCDLAAIVGLSEAGVSQHLRMLRHLRVVKSRREGKLVYYSLDDGHVRTLLSVALNHFEHGRIPEPAEGMLGSVDAADDRSDGLSVDG